MKMFSNLPLTIFHITHWKAGSQWVAEILKHSAPERFIPWRIVNSQAYGGRGESAFLSIPLKPGSIYGTVYLTRRRFERRVFRILFTETKRHLKAPHLWLNNWWYFSVRKAPYKRFFVMRDLRDTLISFYFSTKNSHEIDVNVTNIRRQKLNALSEEDGLIYLMREVFPVIADIQASWLGAADTLILKYENILENELEMFEQLIDYCQINIDLQVLQNIIKNNSFENVTGRKRGNEDNFTHNRKGIIGDWRNYFTETIKLEFKQRYGQLLIDTGYEKDLYW